MIFWQLHKIYVSNYNFLHNEKIILFKIDKRIQKNEKFRHLNFSIQIIKYQQKVIKLHFYISISLSSST